MPHGNSSVVTLALRMICLARASDPRGSWQRSHLLGSNWFRSTDRASPSRKSGPKFLTRTADDDCSGVVHSGVARRGDQSSEVITGRGEAKRTRSERRRRNHEAR